MPVWRRFLRRSEPAPTLIYSIRESGGVPVQPCISILPLSGFIAAKQLQISMRAERPMSLDRINKLSEPAPLLIYSIKGRMAELELAYNEAWTEFFIFEWQRVETIYPHIVCKYYVQRQEASLFIISSWWEMLCQQN